MPNKSKIEGNPALVDNMLSYKQKISWIMSSLLTAALFIFGPSIVDYFNIAYSLPKIDSWIIIVFWGCYLSIGIQDELSLQKLDIVLKPKKRREFVLVDKLSQLDEFRRYAFRQRLGDFLDIFFVMPVVIFLSLKLINNSPSFLKCCCIPLIWVLFLFVGTIIKNTVTVKRFGKVKSERDGDQKVI